MFTTPRFLLFSAALALLVPLASAQQAVVACVQRSSGQVRIISEGLCNPSENRVELSSPRAVPDTIPIPVLHFLGLPGGTGNDATVIPFTPFVVVRASLRSDFDSRDRVSVRAVHSSELNPEYAYDGFYMCLAFSPEILDSETLRISVSHTSDRRETPADPVIVQLDSGVVATNVGAFRNGTPGPGHGAACLTFPFSLITKTPSGPYGGIADTIVPPGTFSIILDTPDMLATKPSGPYSFESTNIIGVGLTVAGLASAQ